MILIFSEIEDTSTSKVIEWLIHHNVPFLRINREEFENIELLIKLEPGQREIFVKCNNHYVDISRVKKIWFRRGELTNISPDYFLNSAIPIELKKILHMHLFSEIRALYNFFYSECHGVSINSPLHYVPNKLNVLQLAEKRGLKTPETLVTGNKKELMKFIRTHKNVIGKNIQDIAVIKIKEYIHTQGTYHIDDKLLKEIPDRFCYSLFQRKFLKNMRYERFILKKDFFQLPILHNLTPCQLLMVVILFRLPAH